jgi:hypothetical protein
MFVFFAGCRYVDRVTLSISCQNRCTLNTTQSRKTFGKRTGIATNSLTILSNTDKDKRISLRLRNSTQLRKRLTDTFTKQQNNGTQYRANIHNGRGKG